MKRQVAERIRKLIEEYPGVRNNNMNLLYAYYSIYHNTTDLSRIKDDASAPSPETILRAKRHIFAAEKSSSKKTHV